MRGITNDALKVGDFAYFAGMKVKDMLRKDWWKVTETDAQIVKLVDRTGATARVSATARYQHCHAVIWESGDPRTR